MQTQIVSYYSTTSLLNQIQILKINSKTREDKQKLKKEKIFLICSEIKQVFWKFPFLYT